MKCFSNLSIVCVNQPIEVIINGFVVLPLPEKDTWTKKNIIIDEIFNYYHPKIGDKRWSFVVYSPNINTKSTVYYTNRNDGWPGHFEIRAKKLGWEMYYFSVHANDGIYQNGYHFSRICGNEERHLLCYKEDERWVFYEEGEPLPFEDTERYKERLKRKRVDKELLLKYMRCAGWDLEDDRFWQPVGEVYRFDDF